MQYLVYRYWEIAIWYTVLKPRRVKIKKIFKKKYIFYLNFIEIRKNRKKKRTHISLSGTRFLAGNDYCMRHRYQIFALPEQSHGLEQ